MEYSNTIIDNLLDDYKAFIGVDFDRYKNHVYRVFLNCRLLDPQEDNSPKYAIAAVFHDIGIWTDHTIDYLQPSIQRATEYLALTGQQQWIDEVSGMINWHHKLSSYKGVNAQIINVFRTADWIDVSIGLLNFGLDKKQLKEQRKAFPNLGFHAFLLRATARNFIRHPFNPMPMFRR